MNPFILLLTLPRETFQMYNLNPFNMKTTLNFILFLFVFSAFALLTNCSGTAKEESGTAETERSAGATEHPSQTTAMEVSKPQFQVDKKFQEQLYTVFTNYLQMKDALVSSNAPEIKEEASNTREAVAAVHADLLSGAAKNDWTTYRTAMQDAIRGISETTDIEAQRKAFSILSDNLYKGIKAFGMAGTEAFYQYCPMAFDNEGAYWLSDDSKIRNPYFGDKMLACGEVREVLK
jgi:hypothetical protein